MRGLCAASRLQRVQKQVCSAPVSLGSFSEAQAVVEPALLQRVFAELAAEQQWQNYGPKDQRLEPYRAQLLVVDGTLWRGVPGVGGGLWRGLTRRGGGRGVRLEFILCVGKAGGGRGST